MSTKFARSDAERLRQSMRTRSKRPQSEENDGERGTPRAPSGRAPGVSAGDTPQQVAATVARAGGRAPAGASSDESSATYSPDAPPSDTVSELSGRTTAHTPDDTDKERESARRCWEAWEDEKIRALVEVHGSKAWSTIAAELPTRTGKQCRERWHNHLDPVRRHDDAASAVAARPDAHTYTLTPPRHGR